MSDGADERALPVYTSRRERRDAERAAERAAEAAASATASFAAAPETVLVAETTPSGPRPVQPHPAPLRPSARRSAAPRPAAPRSITARRRISALGRGLLSVGAAAFAAVLAVGMTVPSNVFGAPAPPPPAQAPLEGLFEPSSHQAIVVAAEASVESEARDGYASQSFASVERARYQASGQGFAPGFVPTTGAVRWPFDRSVPISSGFGYSEEYGGDHSGIDFVPGEGAPVGAIADGVVTWVGWDNTGYGYYVKIEHNVAGQQVISIYAHLLDDSSEVFPGQAVPAGTIVGLTGNTGHSYGAHLHLGIQVNGTLVDPFIWLTENATDAPAL